VTVAALRPVRNAAANRAVVSQSDTLGNR